MNQRPPLDGDVATTHVRCGSDIRSGLQEAGFQGDFVEFTDPYCQGPLPRRGDLAEMRARFVSSAYGGSIEEARARLALQLGELSRTVTRPRVVLWFEHDSYDQLILARLLAFYAQEGTPRTLELVCIDGFPGVNPFLGLGQLAPPQLRKLWPARRPVSAAQLRLGLSVWRALRDPSPMALHELAGNSAELPQMRSALGRHLLELPWTTDGLSLTQRLTLEVLASGPTAYATLFRELTYVLDPLPHLGDSMHQAVLREMQSSRRPPIVEAAAGVYQLTAVGREILSGVTHWFQCGPRERWVGGVRILPAGQVWCWDPSSKTPRWLEF